MKISKNVKLITLFVILLGILYWFLFIYIPSGLCLFAFTKGKNILTGQVELFNSSCMPLMYKPLPLGS